ncbi:MAG TPA: tRNA (adenosine(37)-N6)-threonylcarbamoyltransferase complex dimerization subunit type 1 TsaB [Steroidobacteraceae bacterium]|nr:tRNA (adenosine(37)-N6)-threonylcarbamoyltransferase complex dimerization subunit type 1 TsaB [Steroidobacteraceae bacterium]
MSGVSPALHVLAIDTSTELCSAAVVTRDGRSILRSALTERSHADLILPMVDEVLAEAGLRLRDLDGLAFGRGPGGFTGLRIAAGVVQGLAYGAGLKVAPVSSLAAVAFLASHAEAGEVAEGILVCNDARMNELYWACYRFDAADPLRAHGLTAERVSPPDRVEPAPGVRHFAGNGIARHPQLRERLEAAGLRFHDGLYPRADAIARLGVAMLGRGEGVDAMQALPTYVRDDVARPAAGPVTGMS